MGDQIYLTDKGEIYAMVSFGHKEREGEKNANFFFYTYSGMVDAAKLIDPDIKIEWHGPNAWDPVPEIKAIQELTARQVDGIMVTAADKTALDPSINAAIQAGIPVINFDADSPASTRLTFVGTNNYKAGYLAGRTMAEWLGEQGDVAVSTIQHADHLVERLRGFEDALHQFAPGRMSILPMVAGISVWMSLASRITPNRGWATSTYYKPIQKSAGYLRHTLDRELGPPKRLRSWGCKGRFRFSLLILMT